jgi:hypothetical protein
LRRLAPVRRPAGQLDSTKDQPVLCFADFPTKHSFAEQPVRGFLTHLHFFSFSSELLPEPESANTCGIG